MSRISEDIYAYLGTDYALTDWIKTAALNNIQFYRLSCLRCLYGFCLVLFFSKTKLDQTHMRRENLATGGGGQV